MLMNKNEYIPVAGLATIILAAPFLPRPVFALLDMIVVRILIVAGLVAAMFHGYATGLLTLAAIAVLYMERNKRKVDRARKRFESIKLSEAPISQATVEEEAKPQETVPVQEFDIPEDKEFNYLPQRKMGSDEFERVPFSEELNDKTPLRTVPIGAKSASIFTAFVGPMPKGERGLQPNYLN